MFENPAGATPPRPAAAHALRLRSGRS